MDPEHESELQSIKVKAMLNDMLSNDPILSSYQPHQVLEAYNNIAQLSPTMASQPAVMRGMLRRSLQQGGVVEPFEAEQMSNLERKLRPGPMAGPEVKS